MSNISAKSGGSLSLVQFLLNQSRRFACLAPRVLSSGILCETLEMLGQPPAEVVSPGAAWFRNAWTLSASRRRSWSLCTAFTSFSPGLSLRRTAPENRPSSVSVSWWAFRADVNCIKADTKSGCFVSDWSINCRRSVRFLWASSLPIAWILISRSLLSNQSKFSPRTSIPFAAWWYKYRPRRSSSCRWSSWRYGWARPRRNRPWSGSADRPGTDRRTLAPVSRTPPPSAPTASLWRRTVAKARSFATPPFPLSRTPPPGPPGWRAAKKYSPNERDYRKKQPVAASSSRRLFAIWF